MIYVLLGLVLLVSSGLIDARGDDLILAIALSFGIILAGIADILVDIKKLLEK